VGGVEACRVDKDESNIVISLLKMLEGRYVSGESLVVCFKWVYREKSRGATKDGRRVLRYVRWKKKTMEAAIQRRSWNPGIMSAFRDNTLRAKWF
jgi:hypothetical protein